MADRVSPSRGDMLAAAVASPIPIFEELLEENAVHEGSSSRQPGVGSDAEPESAAAAMGAGDPEVHRVGSTSGARTLNGLVEELNILDLSQEDLTDLHVATSFIESKTDYPMSGDISSWMSSFPIGFAAAGNNLSMERGGLQSLSRNANEGHAEQKVLSTFCVDLRDKEPGVHKFSIVRILQTSEKQDIRAGAAVYFQCEESEIHEGEPPRHSSVPSVPVLMVKKADQNLAVILRFVSHKEGMACLLVSREVIFAAGLSMCKRWLDTTFMVPASCEVCLLRNGDRLTGPHAFRNLRDFEVLELTRVDTLTLKFVCRLSQHSDKSYYVDCNDTDYVREVKEKFWKVFVEDVGEPQVDAAPEFFWLTSGDAVVFPDRLLRSVLNPQDTARSLESDSGHQTIVSDTFHVHFQPRDSVLVKINFRADSRKSLKSESVIMASPSAATPQTLRQQVSRVIHKNPLSFRMLISGKKVDQDTALEPFLRAPNCTVVVEQRPQIELKVTHDMDRQQVADFPVTLHRYERVEALKRCVCSDLDVPTYCVDLRHNDVVLDDASDLRGSRLRHGDAIQALVRPNRIRVRVKLTRAHGWRELVVDNATATTVGQLLAYVQAEESSLSRQSPLGPGQGLPVEAEPCSGGVVITFKAIHLGEFLALGSTLRAAGVDMNSRVLVIQERSLCYTAACRGRVAIFRGRSPSDLCAGPVIHREIAMCDGVRVYYDPVPSKDEPVLYEAPQQLNKPCGLEPCSQQLRDQFPPYSTEEEDTRRSTPSPAGRATTQRPYVCRICKSTSLPVFPTASPIERRMSQSQSSSSFLHAQCSSLDAAGSAGSGGNLRESATRFHSTPLSDRSCHEQSTDFVDSPNLGTSSLALSRPRSIRQDDYFSDSSHTRLLAQKRRASAETPLSGLAAAMPRPLPPLSGLAAAMPRPLALNGRAKNLGGGDAHNDDDAKQADVNGPSQGGGGRGGGGSPESAELQYGQPALLSPLQSSGQGRGSPWSFPSGSGRPEEDGGRKPLFHLQHLQSVEQDEDGRLVATARTETKRHISLDQIRGDLASFQPCRPVPYPALLGEQVSADDQQGIDMAFVYVKKETINFIADNLGSESTKVMMELLPHKEVTRIEESYPKNSFRQNFECLRRWCQMEGKKASVDRLMKVLKENDRKDLVDYVRAKKQGYETSP